MRKINSVQGQLEWVQPRALTMSYELRSYEELVARLGFRSVLGSFATAESADGCWTFKRVGFLQTRATIRACGRADRTRRSRHSRTTPGAAAAMTLADGREFLITTNVWQTKLEIQTAAGEALVHLQTSGVWQNSASVDLTPTGLHMPELPLLALFAWYVIVMMQMDAGGVAAISPASHLNA